MENFSAGLLKHILLVTFNPYKKNGSVTIYVLIITSCYDIHVNDDCTVAYATLSYYLSGLLDTYRRVTIPLWKS